MKGEKIKDSKKRVHILIFFILLSMVGSLYCFWYDIMPWGYVGLFPLLMLIIAVLVNNEIGIFK